MSVSTPARFPQNPHGLRHPRHLAVVCVQPQWTGTSFIRNHLLSLSPTFVRSVFQTSTKRAVETTDITRSFGWDSSDGNLSFQSNWLCIKINLTFNVTAVVNSCTAWHVLCKGQNLCVYVFVCCLFVQTFDIKLPNIHHGIKTYKGVGVN